MRPISVARVAAELLLLVAILVGLNALAARHHARGDWTRGHAFTLSDKTTQVLRALERPVEVIVFMVATGEEANDLYQDTRELLERARRIQPNLRVEYVDVDREPERLKIVGKKYGVSGDDLVNGVIVVDAEAPPSAPGDTTSPAAQGRSVGPPDTTSPAAQGRSKFITREELAEYDWGNAEEGRPPRMKAWKGEQALVSALLAVTEERSRLLCFTRGHGEPALDSFEPGEYGDFAEELKRDDYQVRAIDLASLVPPECDVLVVAGPQQPLAADEVHAVDAYLERGGRFFGLLGPTFDPKVTRFVPIGIEELLARWGADLRNDVVVDLPRLRGSVVAFALSEGYADHPITAKLMHHRTLFSNAREVRATPKPGLSAREILHTSDQGWGETNLGVFRAEAELSFDSATDVKGPVPIAVAVEREAGTGRGARLVVIGSSELAGGRQVLAYNRDLLLSSVAWLVKADPKIAIGPRPTEHVRLSLDDSQLRRVFWVCVVALPLLALLLGGGVFWLRRS